MSDNPTDLCQYFYEQAQLSGLPDATNFWRSMADGFRRGNGVPDSYLETAISELMKMIEMCELACCEDDHIIDSMEADRKRADRLIELLEQQRYGKPETQAGTALRGRKLDRLCKESD